MGDRVRKFQKARLAQQTGSAKPTVSLGELEQRFVDKFTEKYKLTERDIARAFKRFDSDGSGFLDVPELTSAISLFLNGVDRADVLRLVQRYDVDGDGSISLEEFSAFLISRTNPNKSEWLTVDSLPTRASPADDSFVSADEEGDRADEDDAAAAGRENSNPQSATHKAKIFLQNMKAMLLRRAVELKLEGKISLVDRLSQHANPLAESTARGIVSKAFLPYMKNGTRVDFASFSRVIVKFVYPGSPPPRQDVALWLFKACGGTSTTEGGSSGSSRGADPDVLIDMVFDEGGVRLNKWGFVQPVAAASDVGRPQVARGPIVRRSGALPAQIKDVAYRYQTSRSHTTLAAPSDFDPRLLDRSTQLPSLGLRREFVYGASSNLLSGEPILVLPASASTGGNTKEVVYCSAALVVIHDLAANTQRFFDGHDDDVSCFAVSCLQPGGYTAVVASGQVGHSPELLLWESALQPRISTPSPMLTQLTSGSPPRRGSGSPGRGGRAAGFGEATKTMVGLLARLGRGFFQRCIVATAFSGDGAFVCAIGGDDKHDMGIWAVATGEMLASMPTANGIPPQIKAVQWAPLSQQDTAFIAQDHLDFDCDLIVTAGAASNIKFWSFKRPNRAGIGALLANRLHSIGRAGVPPAKTYTSAAFISQSFTGGKGKSRLEGQFDCLTGGDNGYVYLWRGAACVMGASAVAGGVFTLATLGSRVYAGGAKGQVAILDGETLAPLLSLNALAGIGGSPASALVSGSSFDRPASGAAAGTQTKRVSSAPPGTAGGFGIFSQAATAAAAGGGRGSGAGSGSGSGSGSGAGSGAKGAASRGLGLAKKTAAKGPTAAQQQWSGPGEREDKSVESGVAGSSALLGLVILPAEPAAAAVPPSAGSGAGAGAGLGGLGRAGSGTGSATGAGSGADQSKTPVLLVTTAFGRAIRVPLPSARALSAAASAGSASATSAAAAAAAMPKPETAFFFHYGPLWATASAPPGSAGLGPSSAVFASGGDDSWLCVWDAQRRRLLVRAKAPVPIRSIGFGAPLPGNAGSLVAVGHVSGVLSVFHLAFQKQSQGSGAAFSRADPSSSSSSSSSASSLSHSLTEVGCRRDCREELSDVKFSPSGRMLAAGSHDNFIDVYSVRFVPGADVVRGLDRDSTPAVLEMKPLRRLRGHSSYLAHLDWSADSRLLRSCCGAYELLHWDVGTGKQALSSADALEGDTVWASHTVSLGFSLMGVWPAGAKGTDLNAVDCSEGLGVCVTADDGGRLSLFNFPCIVADAPSKIYTGHSSHVLCARFLELPQAQAQAHPQAQAVGLVVSVGGNDCSCQQWAVRPEPARLAR